MNHYPISAPHGHETPNHTPGCMCECCWGNVVEAEAREARETGFGAEGMKVRCWNCWKQPPLFACTVCGGSGAYVETHDNPHPYLVVDGQKVYLDT